MKKRLFAALIIVVAGILVACNVINNPVTSEEIIMTPSNVPDVSEIPESSSPSVDKQTVAARWNSVNKDVVGSISVTDILDYPVVTTPDNQNEYLNLDIYRKESKSGTLFTAEDAVFAQSTVTTIFGHSMKDGTFFGNLKSYQDIEYLKRNPIFSISDLNTDYVCKVIAVANVSADYYLNDWYYARANYTPELFDDFVKEIRSRSDFIIQDKFDYESRYILLSTCSYKYENERLIVLARIMEPGEEVDPYNPVKNPSIVRTVEYYEKFGGTRPSDDKIQAFLDKYYE